MLQKSFKFCLDKTLKHAKTCSLNPVAPFQTDFESFKKIQPTLFRIVALLCWASQICLNSNPGSTNLSPCSFKCSMAASVTSVVGHIPLVL